MSSSSKQTQQTSSQSDFNRTGTQTVTNLPDTRNQFYSSLNGFNQLNRGVLGSGPGFQFGPIFSNQLDPIVQQMRSQAIQGVLGQQNAANNRLASNLSIAGTGDNSALLAALQNRNSLNTAGALNAINPQIAQMQRDFDLQRNQIQQGQNQLRLGAYEAGLQGRLGQLGQQANLVNILAGLQRAGAGTSTSEAGSGSLEAETIGKLKKGLLSK